MLSFLFGCFSLLFICRQAGDVKELLQDIERSLTWSFPAPCYRLVRNPRANISSDERLKKLLMEALL